MIRFFLISHFILLSFIGAAQKMSVDYFNEGQTFLSNEQYPEAIGSLKYLVDNCPKFNWYADAHYNLGYAYYKNKQYSEAIAVFREILGKDSIETVDYSGDIMSNPYSNFKNGAAYLISQSYFDTGQYDSALVYLELSETVYPYEHFCGNAIGENEVEDQIYKAKIYEALGQNDRFEHILLSSVFLAEEYSIAPLHLLRKYYQKNFKGSVLRKEAQKAFEHIEKEQAPNSKICRYFITFHQTRILVSGSFDQFTALEGKPTETDLMQSSFYNMLLQIE